MDLSDDEKPSDDIIADDVEIERWWKAHNNPNLAKMKTKSKNSLGGKDVESFSF